MDEKEYIERERATEFIDKCLEHEEELQSVERETLIAIKKRLESVPAADVRPVVLCRDCKHAQMTIDGLCKYCDRLTEIGVDDAVYLSEDFFCAAGEKREE